MLAKFLYVFFFLAESTFRKTKSELSQLTEGDGEDVKGEGLLPETFTLFEETFTSLGLVSLQ